MRERVRAACCRRSAERFRRIVEEGIGAGDESVLDAFVAPDVPEHQRGNNAGLQGAKGVARVLHRWMSDLSFTVEDLVVSGDTIRTRNRARGVNTGAVMGLAPTIGRSRSTSSMWGAISWSNTGVSPTRWDCSCRSASIPAAPLAVPREPATMAKPRPEPRQSGLPAAPRSALQQYQPRRQRQGRAIPDWYHSAMAMTLRLTPEDEQALTQLAEAEGVSKQEATVRAIHEAASRRVRRDQVTALSAAARDRYADLLDRLGK